MAFQFVSNGTGWLQPTVASYGERIGFSIDQVQEHMHGLAPGRTWYLFKCFHFYLPLFILRQLFPAVMVPLSSASHEPIHVHHLYKHTQGCHSVHTLHIHSFPRLICFHLVLSVPCLVLSIAQAQKPAHAIRTAKKRCMPVENPMHAMYIKTSQPTKQALPTQRERENQKPSPNQTACKCIKKTNNLFICSKETHHISSTLS